MKMDKKLSSFKGFRPADRQQGLCLRPQTPVIGLSSVLAMVRSPLANLGSAPALYLVALSTSPQESLKVWNTDPVDESKHTYLSLNEVLFVYNVSCVDGYSVRQKPRVLPEVGDKPVRRVLGGSDAVVEQHHSLPVLLRTDEHHHPQTRNVRHRYSATRSVGPDLDMWGA